MYQVPIDAFHVKQEFWDDEKRYMLPTDPKIVVLPATYVSFFLISWKVTQLFILKKTSSELISISSYDRSYRKKHVDL